MFALLDGSLSVSRVRLDVSLSSRATTVRSRANVLIVIVVVNLV